MIAGAFTHWAAIVAGAMVMSPAILYIVWKGLVVWVSFKYEKYDEQDHEWVAEE